MNFQFVYLRLQCGKLRVFVSGVGVEFRVKFFHRVRKHGDEVGIVHRLHALLVLGDEFRKYFFEFLSNESDRTLLGRIVLPKKTHASNFIQPIQRSIDGLNILLEPQVREQLTPELGMTVQLSVPS